MNKKIIINTFKNLLDSNTHISKAIFGDSPIPDDIEEIELALSSLDFVDLIVDLEERLGFEIADKCMMDSKVKIREIVKIIQTCYRSNKTKEMKMS